MNAIAASTETFAAAVPTSLLSESGKVFYSGRNAFSPPASIYVLGVNLGGDLAYYKSGKLRPRAGRRPIAASSTEDRMLRSRDEQTGFSGTGLSTLR